MDFTPKTLLKIKAAYPGFSPKFRVIADFICKNPDKIVNHKVCEIAKFCHCDEAQVVRFCQNIGFDGIRGLRAALALEFIPINRTHENGATQFESLKHNFISESQRAINDTLANIQEIQAQRAIKIIRQAKRIVLAGAGSSNLAAQDFQTKLFRMGFPATTCTDPELAKISCALLEKLDCLIVFSFSGETRNTIELADVAKQHNAQVIAITNYPESILGKKANCILQTYADELPTRIGAMTSLISQLSIIDFISIWLTQTNESGDIEANVIKTHQTVHHIVQ